MKRLSELNISLLTKGASITGTFVEGYWYSEEEFYCNEADELLKFCEYIDNEIGGAARGNIQMLFSAFKNPTDKFFTYQAQQLKERILEIKNR